jgi:lipopolysaccharide/colanic/teichoic acid biosynthesis glycosyltransferase
VSISRVEITAKLDRRPDRAPDFSLDVLPPEKTAIGNAVDLGGLRCLLPACSQEDESAFKRCLGCVPTSNWGRSTMRRMLDISLAAAVLAIMAVPMLLIACAIRFTSPGPALFRQDRVGVGGRLFKVLKFRTMAVRKNQGSGLTAEGDSRITPLGRFLRKLKLDELPQFLNVLKGEMSIVGPRPKLPQFAAIPNMPYRPGITGIASIAFRFEEQILSSLEPDRVESFYSHRIKPLKANLDVCYMCEASPASDLRVIMATAVSCIWPRWVPHVLGVKPETPAFVGIPTIKKQQRLPRRGPAAVRFGAPELTSSEAECEGLSNK